MQTTLRLAIMTLSLLALIAPAARAQQPAEQASAQPGHSGPGEPIDFWPADKFAGRPLGSGERVDGEQDGKGGRHVAGVQVPQLFLHRPEGEPTGAAVIICPGGGYAIEAIDKEGHDVAEFLAGRGVTALVLKYRLPQGDSGDRSPLDDAERAVRYVRANAEELGIDPAQIGIMGFSAGGHLASYAATHFDSGDASADDPVAQASSHPDFQVLVYPVTSMRERVGHSGSKNNLLGSNATEEARRDASTDEQVTAETPTAFLVHTSDDPVSCLNSLRYAQALKTAGVPFELHLYESGGHGYGMLDTGNLVNEWPERLADWMASKGWARD